MKLFIALSALEILASCASGMAAQESPDPRERAFSYCFACHSIDPGEESTLTGPNLAGIIGRPVASRKDFDYSAGMKAFAPGKVWTPERILQFIQEPEVLVPGTQMQRPPGPVTKEERAALIDYLQAH